MFRHRCRATEGLRVRKLPEAIRSAGSVRRSLIGISAAVTVAAGLAVPGAVASAADGGGAAGVSGAAGTPASLAPATDGAANGGAVIVVLKAQQAGMNLRTQASQRRAAARSSQAPVTSDITAHGGTGVQSLVAPDAVAAHVPAGE